MTRERFTVLIDFEEDRDVSDEIKKRIADGIARSMAQWPWDFNEEEAPRARRVIVTVESGDELIHEVKEDL